MISFKACTCCNIEKQLSEYYSNKAYCKTCTNIKSKEYYKNHSEVIIKYNKGWVSDNKDKVKEYKKKYRDNNNDKTLELSREYRLNNQDKILQYYLNNKSSFIARSRNREISKINRTPNWLTRSDFNRIKALYECANRLSKCLNILHHVDHVIPLQGKLVSGLHVPNNLQVIPASINLSKGNLWQTS